MIMILEAAIAVILLIINIILFHKKGRKKTVLSSILILIIAIIVLSITFIGQKPLIDTNETVEIEAKSGEKLKKPKTTYLWKEITNEVKIIGNIDYNRIGKYEVEYEIPMVFGKYNKKQTVNIIDTIAPEIKLEGGEEINQSYTKKDEEFKATAIDNYDGDITDKINIEKIPINENQIQIKYTVSDSSGNTTSKIRKVNLIDDIPPTITLNGNQKVSVILGNSYTEQGAKAIDEKEGDLTEKIQVDGFVNTSKIGNYTITYKVCDSSGNEAVKKREVSVINKPEVNHTSSNNENKKGKGVIYLTFDDGPSSSITPKILDILKKKNVKATFFILNYDSAREELVKREVNEGHAVGMHGYSHDYKKIYQSVDTYMENITKLQTKIKNSIGYNSVITRFPGGSSNTVSRYNPGIMTKLTKEVVARGYRYYDWNVSSGDAGEAKSSKDVYNTVTKGLKRGRANIVLMHDFSGNTKTLNALEDIINYGIKQGYTFDKITENTPMVTHSVNN